jgi:CrcB protein
VFLGGALGTAARAALVATVPSPPTWPVTVFAVNVIGSLLLGALVGTLGRRPATARGRSLRLLLGTGMLGGFTTYSALALDTVHLALGGQVLQAVVVPVASVVVGIAAAALGIALAGGSPSRPAAVPSSPETTGPPSPETAGPSSPQTPGPSSPEAPGRPS